MYVSGEQGHSKIIQMNESWRMEMWYEIPAGFLIQPLSCVKGDGIYVTVPLHKAADLQFHCSWNCVGHMRLLFNWFEVCLLETAVPLRFKIASFPLFFERIIKGRRKKNHLKVHCISYESFFAKWTNHYSFYFIDFLFENDPNAFQYIQSWISVTVMADKPA